jgi:hypothetical protein
VPWLRLLVAGLSPRGPEFVRVSVHVEFRQTGIAMGFSLIYSVFSCQYHSTGAACSYMILGLNSRPFEGTFSPRRHGHGQKKWVGLLVQTQPFVCNLLRGMLRGLRGLTRAPFIFDSSEPFVIGTKYHTDDTRVSKYRYICHYPTSKCQNGNKN